MKIIVEQTDLEEPEVVIRGNPGDPRVAKLVAACNAAVGTGKLFLYRDGREYLYNFRDVAFFETNGNKAYGFVNGEAYETRHKLYELEELAYPFGFVQINKGVLVNVGQVRSVEAEFSGNYVAVLKQGKTRLTISRKYIKAFRHYVMEVY
ncbi:LytTR family DNA-binding domain-containing protein [Agathobaculum sp.]|uniref:LytTR family DNA-binding domain-containing protein n=1 Tax=Agathobaculum sp. TaxID=2048138 RepID=UPI002A832472|nr:LytTR family DNA-binding domain-containing protein [Agathobaculum sp.]MDY3618959.1 LytTR family DNA-binding domain-containing protein [Agathobaculum sp.]